MRNTARSHFVEVVLPAFDSFVTHYANREVGLRRDTRNGAIVAEALRDLPEHVYSDLQQALRATFATSRQYRESFWPRCGAYEIICDFANAWKHRRLTRKGKTLSSLDDVKEFLAHIRYEDQEGFYYGLRKIVVVSVSDQNHELSNLLSESMHLWTKELVDRGIIPNAPRLPEFQPLFRSRKELENLTKMRILGQKSEYLEIHQLMMIFRPDSNTLTAVAPGEHFDHKAEIEMEILSSPLDS